MKNLRTTAAQKVVRPWFQRSLCHRQQEFMVMISRRKGPLTELEPRSDWRNSNR